MIKQTCLWIAIVACGGAKPPAAKPIEPDFVVANRYFADHALGGIAGPPPLIGPPPTVRDVYLAALDGAWALEPKASSFPLLDATSVIDAPSEALTRQ